MIQHRLDEPPRAEHARLENQALLFVRPALLGDGLTRQMDDRIDSEQCLRGHRALVVPFETRRRKRQPMPGALRVTNQADQRVAASRQCLAQFPADQAGCSCHQDAHVAPSLIVEARHPGRPERRACRRLAQFGSTTVSMMECAIRRQNVRLDHFGIVQRAPAKKPGRSVPRCVGVGQRIGVGDVRRSLCDHHDQAAEGTGEHDRPVQNREACQRDLEGQRDPGGCVIARPSGGESDREHAQQRYHRPGKGDQRQAADQGPLEAGRRALEPWEVD